jgi:hypothetical protein
MSGERNSAFDGCLRNDGDLGDDGARGATASIRATDPQGQRMKTKSLLVVTGLLLSRAGWRGTTALLRRQGW